MDWREEEGRAAFEAEEARAQEDAARAGQQEEPPAPAALQRRDRVVWCEPEEGHALDHGSLGTITKISKSGYVHVEWDEPCRNGARDGYFSPAKAAAVLRLAEGEDALPRHVWVTDPPASPDEPVCAVCKAAQTDDNEFGACQP
jgi:hypothetical protein